MIKHPVGHRHVERRVFERQGLHVPHTSVDTALAGELDHPRRKIDGNDVHPEVGPEPLGELAPATADLEHAARRRLADRLEGELPRIRA